MSALWIVSPSAQRDIQDIFDYVAQHSWRNAAKVVHRLYDQFEIIAHTPGIGHVREELNNDQLRTISVYRYLVIYNPMSRPIEIIRIIHGAMDLETEFME